MNKNLILKGIVLLIALFVITPDVKAQFSFPPDTTTYWKMNEAGVVLPYTRGKDSTIYKGQMVIRFRQGALNYEKLMHTYSTLYNGMKQYHKGNTILSWPTLPCDSNRGFPDILQYYLKTERFYIDSSSNIILDTALRNFLHLQHGIYLRRLTTASPKDMFSVTRRGDTIGCDHYNWMILKYDTTVNALFLAYALNVMFPRDIIFAEPDRHEGELLHSKPSHPHDDPNLYDKCEFSLYNMINAPKAWDYEVGNPKILIAHFDQGADYRHTDLGGQLGLGHHVLFGEQFSINKNSGMDLINQHQEHGTQCLGIIGALTNRNFHSIAGVAGGWGVLPTDSIGSIDEGTGCSLAILAAGNFTTPIGSISDYVAAVFEAAALSDSSNYGYGANVINTSARIESSEKNAIHAAINYAFLNGVIQIAAVANSKVDETNAPYYDHCWPANYDEPWMISVGGSNPNKVRIFSDKAGSDYGFTMDLLAPAGDPNAGDSVWVDQYGPIKCSNNNTNWNESFTTANITQYDEHNPMIEIDSPRFTYRGLGGNSAAAPHVAGSAGLLLSSFLRDTSVKLEPEDVQGILKASAWRGDSDRIAHDSLNFWRTESGWGHLDIGHTYEMMDPTPGFSTGNMYFLKYFHFDTGLDSSNWSRVRLNSFQICWDSSICGFAGFKKKFKNREYLLNDSASRQGSGRAFVYNARYRTISKTVTIDSMWDVSTDAPLFAWGRSGGLNEKSGWNYDQENWQTGWSRLTSSTGGNDLNEGIFHSQGTTFTIISVQYDVWGWSDSAQGYTNYIGHIPDDSMIGVNFSVFGRKNLGYSTVRNVETSNNEVLLVQNENDLSKMTIRYYANNQLNRPRFEIYDILGKQLLNIPLEPASSGWNSENISYNRLPSGTYICRVVAENYTQSRAIQIIR